MPPPFSPGKRVSAPQIEVALKSWMWYLAWGQVNYSASKASLKLETIPR